MLIASNAEASNPNNAVWGVYDEFRTARLNVKYLEAEIRRLNRLNFWHEVVIAISTSSAVAGFSFWQTFFGGYLWTVIGGVAAILSILKPILKLQDQISKKQELLASYRVLDHDLIGFLLRLGIVRSTTTQFTDSFSGPLNARANSFNRTQGPALMSNSESSVEKRWNASCL